MESKNKTNEIKELLQSSEFKEIVNNEEFRKMYNKMHNPWAKRYDIRPNDICPFCYSGKKFKKCTCNKALGYRTTNNYNYDNN